MIAEFIKPQDQRWIAFLKNCQHDFYHLPGYVELAARYEGGTPIAFYAEDGHSKFLAPLLVKRVPSSLRASDDWYDAVTPYGYPTPLITPSSNSSSLANFLEAFRKVGVESGITTAFFRLHPLMSLPKEALDKYGMLIKHGQTVYVDLSLSQEEIWSQTRHDHREDINKQIRLGFQAKMDDWSLFEEFLAIYKTTMKRVSASDFFMFHDSYFADLRSTLGDNLHLCSVLSPEGEVASTAIVTSINGIVQSHLGGTSDKHLRQSPSKLQYEFTRRWAKETGNLICHFGGGVGGRPDSLFKFKAGFSKLRADFYTYRMVLDETKYTALTYLYKQRYGDVEDGDTDFFPDYRKCA